MGNYTIFLMFENPRRGRQARNFTENDPKILGLKSSSEQIIFRKLSLGAPVRSKSVKNKKLIESIECFLCVLFLDIPESCIKKKKKNAFECYISREKKKKENKRIGIKTKESGFYFFVLLVGFSFHSCFYSQVRK